MRLYAFRFKYGQFYGRFHVRNDFKIYVDWRIRELPANRWKVSVNIQGKREYATGPTLASALTTLYTYISQDYSSLNEYGNILFPTLDYTRKH